MTGMTIEQELFDKDPFDGEIEARIRESRGLI